MHDEVDFARAQALARDVLAWLNECSIPPIPENFELAFAYVTGEHPNLKHTIDGLISNGCKFDSSVMSILHQRFFRAPRDESVTIDLSEKITGELSSVLQLLNLARRDQSEFGSTLSQASGELGQTDIPYAAIRSVIDRVINATHRMEARSNTLEQQLQSSAAEVLELRTRLESVRRDSLTDALTQIPNRRAFDAELQKAIEESFQHGTPVSLIMCDIDHFKKFNDRWGHQTGDQVLRLVAQCVSANIKGRDTAARFGGEEFAVILPETSLADAVGLSDQIRISVASKKLVKKSTGDTLGTITISAGVAQFDQNESAVDFILRADNCLYAAKRAGRNRVISDPDQSEKSSIR